MASWSTGALVGLIVLTVTGCVDPIALGRGDSLRAPQLSQSAAVAKAEKIFMQAPDTAGLEQDLVMATRVSEIRAERVPGKTAISVIGIFGVGEQEPLWLVRYRKGDPDTDLPFRQRTILLHGDTGDLVTIFSEAKDPR